MDLRRYFTKKSDKVCCPNLVIQIGKLFLYFCAFCTSVVATKRLNFQPKLFHTLSNTSKHSFYFTQVYVFTHRFSLYLVYSQISNLSRSDVEGCIEWTVQDWMTTTRFRQRIGYYYNVRGSHQLLLDQVGKYYIVTAPRNPNIY